MPSDSIVGCPPQVDPFGRVVVVVVDVVVDVLGTVVVVVELGGGPPRVGPSARNPNAAITVNRTE
jgi:hypothetical protein